MSGARWSESFGAVAQSSMHVYESVMVPRMFTPWAELLLDELELTHGEAVLDVACGPGSVARLAAARVGEQGRVVGCDLSAAMLAIAGQKPAVSGGSAIEYHEAPAEHLPFANRPERRTAYRGSHYRCVTLTRAVSSIAPRPIAKP